MFTCGSREVSPEERKRKTPSGRTHLENMLSNITYDIGNPKRQTGNAVAAAKGELWMGRTSTAVNGGVGWWLGFIVTSNLYKICNNMLLACRTANF